MANSNLFFSIVYQKLSLGSESRPVSRLYFPALLSRLNSELPLEYQTEVKHWPNLMRVFTRRATMCCMLPRVMGRGLLF